MSIKELTLDGLNCVNCAYKIEEKVNQVDGITNANLNFVSKTLKVELAEAENMNRIIDEVQSIVKKLEPDVVVREKHIQKTSQKNLLLLGIICTSCGDKIEQQIKKLDDVRDARINFTTGKLSIDVIDDTKWNEIAEKSKKIIKTIEPEIEVVSEDQKQEIHSHDQGEPINKKKLIPLGIGAALFAIALAFPFSFGMEFTLFSISYLLVGGKIVLRAGKNILRGQVFDENFLMSVATLGAFAIGEYPEGVAVMLFYQIGEFFQDLAVHRSRKSIKDLMDIRPDYANLIINGELSQVDPESVNIGDFILIKPGEKVPLDGKITEGESMVDTSALTGESVPRKVVSGKDVLSGFINKNGVITVQVTKSFEESTVSKILDLVENASSKKAPTEQYITKFARYYTPVVVYSALALALIPPLLIPEATFEQWIYRALVFLVISCPCALVVSIPLGFFGGIGGASKNGILIKGGNYLEALNDIDIIVFDKTGTLTKGVFEVSRIEAKDSFTTKEVLEYVAHSEIYSSHPIATSILKKYDKQINKDDIQDYNEISGHGIKALVKTKEVLAGNAKLMKLEKIPYDEVEVVGSIVHIAIDKQYAGYIIIADEVKENVQSTIKVLKSLGIRKTIMLTGDNKAIGEKIAHELEIDEVYTELLPDQKVEKLEMLDKEKRPKGKLVFVGDGINDAPVLARADIGIAMGGLGSDAAIEAADVVLMTDEPAKLISAIKIAKRTRRIVLQNIIFALGVKAFFLTLGALGIATMWEAVFADVGVTLIAVLNALRVMKVRNV